MMKGTLLVILICAMVGSGCGIAVGIIDQVVPNFRMFGLTFLPPLLVLVGMWLATYILNKVD